MVSYTRCYRLKKSFSKERSLNIEFSENIQEKIKINIFHFIPYFAWLRFFFLQFEGSKLCSRFTEAWRTLRNWKDSVGLNHSKMLDKWWTKEANLEVMHITPCFTSAAEALQYSEKIYLKLPLALTSETRIYLWDTSTQHLKFLFQNLVFFHSGNKCKTKPFMLKIMHDI